MPGGLQAEHDLSLDGVSAPVDGGDGPGPDDPAVPAEVLLRGAAVPGCGSPGPNTRYASGSAEAGGWVVIVEKVGFRTRFGIFPSPDPGWSFIGLRSVASDVVDMAGVGARAVVPGKTEPPGLPPRLLWRGRLTDRSTAASARPVQVVSAGPGW
jgi:hypothetical protein